MHGLIFKAIQSFFCNTYGRERWDDMISTAGLAQTGFEAMLSYDRDVLEQLLGAITLDLRRPQPEILEDLGTFLVSHPQMESLRRLLRFGGETYTDFLHSLDDMPDRARLAVADLDLPTLEVRERAKGLFSLTCGPGLPGFASVLIGMLRTMADDYGALVMLDHAGIRAGNEVITIALVQNAFAQGRDFDLGARAG